MSENQMIIDMIEVLDKVSTHAWKLASNGGSQSDPARLLEVVLEANRMKFEMLKERPDEV